MSTINNRDNHETTIPQWLDDHEVRTLRDAVVVGLRELVVASHPGIIRFLARLDSQG
jgi:hypothetical protein